jgi:hypothetical protein
VGGKLVNKNNMIKLKNIINESKKPVLKEGEESQERYMFYNNIKQMDWQTSKLSELDPKQVDDILRNGHDWMEDHIAVAKENLDQVFHFLMREIHKNDNQAK